TRGLRLRPLGPYARRQVRDPRPTILFFSPNGRSVPDFLARWFDGRDLTVVPLTDPSEVEQMVLRSLRRLVVIDGEGGPQGWEVWTRVKGDSWSGVVPLCLLPTHTAHTPATRRSRGSNAYAWRMASCSPSATRIWIISRSTTIATATMTAIALSISCPASCTTW